MDISVIKEMFGSTISQLDSLLSLSTAGVGVIFYIWSRLFGFVKNEAEINYKHPLLLCVPLVAFIISIALYFSLQSAVSGFYWELLTGHAQTGEKITDPAEYFKVEYKNIYMVFSTLQLFLTLAGLIVLSFWLAYNVLKRG